MVNSEQKSLKIAVLGFSREGRSVLTYLKKQPGFRSSHITILDEKKNIPGIPKAKNIASRLGTGYLKNLKQFNVIYRSPGVPYMLPEIQEARRAGSTISSVTQLFFEQLGAYK